MAPVIDLIGQKFHRLTVIEFSGLKNKRKFWKCSCECGEIRIIQHYDLTRNDSRKIKSCGCFLYPKGENYIEFSKTRIKKTCIENESGCWIWQGYKCEPRKQYGLTSLAVDGVKKKILSHRAAYTLWKGSIPEDKQVLHSCDTPLCCNPDHLHLGTAQDNMDEMKERGRNKQPKGEKNHKAKLKNEDILMIRKLFDKGKTVGELSKSLNLANSTISYITRRITWKHI